MGDRVTEQNEAFCTCVGCGHLVPRKSMIERVAEASPYEEVDVSDIPGVSECHIRTERIESRR